MTVVGGVSYQEPASDAMANPSPIGVSLSSPANARTSESFFVAIAETPPYGSAFVTALGLLKTSTIESVVDW